MCSIITISNQKGGVGKTTTTVSLSGAFLQYKKKTLIVDMDPQGNCSRGLGIDPSLLSHTIYDVLVFNYDINKAIKKTKFNGIDILPSNIKLAIIETKLNSFEAYHILKKTLNKIKDNYDYILIDTPPSFGFLTLSSLIASNSVIIPVQCEYFALEAVSLMLATISNVQRQYNKDLKILGFLLTMYDPRLRLATQVTIEVRKLFKEKTFVTQIPRNVSIVESQISGTPVTIHKPSSLGSLAYLALVKEIFLLNNDIKNVK